MILFVDKIGSMFLFLGILVVLTIVVAYLLKGVIKDLREHNLDKYLTFSDVIPKSAFMKIVNRNIQDSPNVKTFSLVYVAVDRISDLESSLNQKIIMSIFQKMVETIRETFANTTIVSAVEKGGFYLFISEEYEYDEVMQTVYELYDKFTKPFDITSQTSIVVNISIAVAFYPIHGESSKELDKVLHMIMRDIRDGGGSAVRTLQSDSGFTSNEYLDYYHELKKAIAEKQFEFHYQPTVDVENNKVVQLSLYLRWNQPKLGVLPATKFTKILEQSGNIYFVGLHGLEMMCEQYKYLSEKFENDDLHLKLIISGREFSNKNLVKDFTKILRKYKTKPTHFVLDVPVSVLLDEREPEISSKIEQLKKLGFKIATDIYSVNLFDLEKIIDAKADILTLSRSFLERQERQAFDLYLEFLKEKMANNQVIIIGEQVETEKERNFYVNNNIHIIQGNLIGKPMPIGDIENWMDRFTGKPIFAKHRDVFDESALRPQPDLEEKIDALVDSQSESEETNDEIQAKEDVVTPEETEPVETPQPEKDLSSLTVVELKEIAKERGLTGYSSMKKAELIELLK